uniref:primosomal protein N' n=1 Tax=Ningiella ruwaisensis TaxID=2364274 RepID=UPI00109F38CB|nr:primosomal protein N' [Ningiella ruwaisensis]
MNTPVISTATLHFKVAVAAPLNRLFDYLPPASTHADDRESGSISSISDAKDWIGCRVEVPFGKQMRMGIVVDFIDPDAQKDDRPKSQEKPHALKPIKRRLDQEPVFNAQMLDFAKWLSQYYLYPIGEALSIMLPAALRKGASLMPAPETYLKKRFTDLNELESSLKQAKKQLGLCARLAQADIPLAKAKKEFSSGIINALIDKSLIEVVEKDYQISRNWPQRLAFAEKFAANMEQSIAISAINAATSFHAYLLEGVTGSGKTEVYLQIIEPVLKAGKQVLILVPEIGLTPQTVVRFEKRFGPVVGVIHSALNDKERLRVWQQVKDGELGILIGTRSSIFTPLYKPGMIIVDEEHDESFKQQDSLRYHARDLAVYRAKQLDIPLVMGSATPSLESLHNALSGKYHHLQLTQRAASASMPTQLLLDIKGQALEFGIAPGLLDKMRVQLEQGNQVLVFVHRRGYAPAILCHQCGYVEECQDCENPFTLHKISNNIQCHRCGEYKAIPKSCPSCGHHELATFGLGTEQIEQGLQATFSSYSCVRIDSDSTRGKNKLNTLLNEINAGKHQILIGTQILSKGHHFPNVTLAIILNVDASLFSADFRAPEKLGQLITQLSGRAGRANKPGEVWLQTHQPQHPLLQDLIQNGFADYARSLLLERKAANLPPYEHQVLIRAESQDIDQILGFLNYAYGVLQQFAKLSLFGPFPCVIEKKQGRYRFMLIAQSASRQYLHAAVSKALPVIENNKVSNNLRWHIDVAPLDFS